MSTLPLQPVTQAVRKKITPSALRQKKERGEPISILTGYDYPTALALDQAGIDAILVGDSLGMVVLGYENTLPVTMEEMLHHCRAVARGTASALLIGDMPFMSYHIHGRGCPQRRAVPPSGRHAGGQIGGRTRTTGQHPRHH